MKPRVVLVVGPLPPPLHGAARVTEQVVARCRALGLVVRTVNTQPDMRRPTYHLERALAHVKALASTAAAGRRSVLYVAGAGGFGLWYQACVLLLARALGRQSYFHHHSYAYLHRRSMAMRCIVAARPVHVVLSPGMAEALTTRYAPASVIIVQSNAAFVDMPVLPEPTPSTGTVRFVHVSNLSLAKGLGTVLCTYAQMRAADIDCTLALAGPFAGEEERRLWESWAGPPVDYLGPLTPPEVIDALLSSDVFLFPSRYANEAEPLVVLEALSCGLRVVASSVGCLPERVKPPVGLSVSGDVAFAAAAAQVAVQEPVQASRESIRAVFSVLRAETPLLDALVE